MIVKFIYKIFFYLRKYISSIYSIYYIDIDIKHILIRDEYQKHIYIINILIFPFIHNF